MADDWIPQPKPDTPIAQLEQAFAASIAASDQAKIYRNLVPQIAKLPAGQDIYFKTRMAAAFGKDFRAGDWNTAIKAIRRPGPRPVLASDGPNPLDSLILSKEGSPRALLANAIILLRHHPAWSGVLGFDAFAYTVQSVKATPWGSKPGRWGDQEDRLTTDWLQHNGVTVGLEVAGQAVQTVARDNTVHPPLEYLESLTWDGTKRIDTWLSLYLGVDKTAYSNAVGARWLRSGVARLERPGVKADCCLILEGRQGLLKSTALKTLCQPWFTDEIADLGTKDAAMQTHGVWLIEIGELGSMSRVEIDKVKAFMSRMADRFRPPYGRAVIEAPRECIFAGTVNPGGQGYLRDETGARRFWPVKCGTINIPALKRDRDQLWAEARDTYRAGLPHWLETQALTSEAEAEQRTRFEVDAWVPLVARHIQYLEDVSVEEILRDAIGKPKDHWTQIDQNRLARILCGMQWERFQARRVDDNGTKYREWRYKPMTTG